MDDKKGFTLLEGVISVALIAVLLLGITMVFTLNTRMQQAGDEFNQATLRYGDALLTNSLPDNMTNAPVDGIEINLTNQNDPSNPINAHDITLRMTKYTVSYDEASETAPVAGGTLFYLK